MKKILVLFFAVLIVACVGCTNENTENNLMETKKAGVAVNTVVETEPETQPENEPKNEKGILTITPDDYYKCVLFELPNEPFREAAVNHMRAQASIEWVCSEDFAVSEKFNSWGINLEWKKGEKCMGIPYADTKVSLEEFKTYMVDGTFSCDSSKWKEVPGNACMSSIFNSIQQFDPNVAGVSNQLMPSYDTFQAKIVGNYSVPMGVKTTNEIISANNVNDIYEAFASEITGDIVIYKDDIKDASHIRMLVEPAKVVRNAAGRINPSRSSVKTIEQTNAFDTLRKDGVKTTWFVDHVYTFEELIAKNYIPITLEIYSKEKTECEIPYLYLDKEIIPEVLAKETAVSTVKSNFPIRFVKIELLDNEGNSVKDVVVHDLHNTRSVSLRSHMPKLFNGLENGDYTLVLTSGIAIGNAELARVDFVYNK